MVVVAERRWGGRGRAFAVDLVAGPHFNPSVDVLRVLAFALMGTFVIAARGYSLLSLGRLRSMLRVDPPGEPDPRKSDQDGDDARDRLLDA